MTKRFRYEMPTLLGLSTESAVGATCSPYGNDASGWMCTEGSCPVSSQCSTGSYAQWCMSGSQAHNTTDENCVSCCSSGTGVSAPGYACNCPTNGSGAVMNCTYGGNATQDCAGGGNYGYCM